MPNLNKKTNEETNKQNKTKEDVIKDFIKKIKKSQVYYLVIRIIVIKIHLLLMMMKYNHSKINQIIRNTIGIHYNLASDTLNLIKNSVEGNCLYYSISYHCYNNFNHHKEIEKKKLLINRTKDH